VNIGAAEFVREDPLERELRAAIHGALTAVKGVTRVEEEDRVTWVVAGQPDGGALTKSAADAVDRLQHKLRNYIENR
jgi:hypothetical protein